MSELLEALEIIKSIETQNYDRRISDYTCVNEECEYEISIIECGLKAFDIIIKKNVDTAKLRLCFMFFDIEKDENEMNIERCAYYNNGQCVEDKLSLVEFTFLKEVFEND